MRPTRPQGPPGGSPPPSTGIVLLEEADFSRLRRHDAHSRTHTATTARMSSPRTDFTSYPSSQGGAAPPPPPPPSRPPHKAPGFHIGPTQRDSSPAALLASDDCIVPGGHRSSSTSTGQVPHSSQSTLHISITHILVGVFLGIVLGIVLYVLEPAPLVVQWIQLPGELFLRAIKCLMVPYVFCAVAVAIGDIVFVGKVSVIGYQTAKMFVLQWLCTAVTGMAVALLFRPLFRRPTATYRAPTNNAAIMGLTCANGKTVALQEGNDTLACVAAALNATDSSSPTAFFFTDLKQSFKTNTEAATTFRKMTVSEQLLTTLTEAISQNIFKSMGAADLLSIITFAMVLGTIAGRQYFTRSRKVNYLYLMLLQVRNTFFLMMEWVIALTPVAVISLVGGSFAASQGVFTYDRANYMYVLAVLLSVSLQIFLLFPALVFVLTRCNPYKHMARMTGAYAFAFACSSSLATAPVTLSCVSRAKVCSRSLANFVISLGVCSNKSSSAYYIPIAVVYLMESSGLHGSLTPWRLVLLFVLSVVACAGTPPIPAGMIVVLTTIFRAIAGVDDMPPQSFAFVLAADFLIDRLATICNVNDDIMALKVVAETTDETVAAEYLGERF